MTIWLIAIALVLLMLVFALWPLLAKGSSLKMPAMVILVVLGASSLVVYRQIGVPDSDAAEAAATPDIAAMVESLAQRLETNPDDIAGWNMLANAYYQLGRFSESVTAYQRLNEIEGGTNGTTLANLGEAMIYADQSALTGAANGVFENALRLSPMNGKALFYSGMAAVQMGNNELAADRWEALLATSPPPEIAAILRERIDLLRGQASAPVTEESAQPLITVDVSLDPELVEVLSPELTVFIIARDPGQPRPPVAAARRTVADLPATIQITDSDAMLPGRPVSAFTALEIVARVSMSGQPVAQTGDWFAADTVQLGQQEPLVLSISEQVP